MFQSCLAFLVGLFRGAVGVKVYFLGVGVQIVHRVGPGDQLGVVGGLQGIGAHLEDVPLGPEHRSHGHSHHQHSGHGGDPKGFAVGFPALAALQHLVVDVFHGLVQVFAFHK